MRFYGSGLYYPVLLEYNPKIEIYNIGQGVSLKILKDRNIAKIVYKNVVEQQGDRHYWLYTAMEGDTFGTIAKRFYKTKEMENRVYLLNPGIRIQPGVKVKILLK